MRLHSIAGVTMCLVLTSVVALDNNTQEETDYNSPSSPERHPYPDITFTTPPDIPISRQYVPYGGPAEEYGPPAKEYGSPIRTSWKGPYPPPLTREVPPVVEYGPPTGFGMPTPEAFPPSGDFTPAGSYPPSGAFPAHGQFPSHGAFPPTGGYPSPGAFANPGIFPTSGAFPPHGAFPSTSGFPPPGAFPPGWGGYEISPADLKSRLYILFEPVAVLVVGVCIFVGIRHYVLPYLIYWARSLEEDEELEMERSLNDPTTLNILKAVTRGICLSRISCQLGMMARNYTIKDLAISAIEDEKNPPRMALIFRDTALGRVQSCEPYICRPKRLPSPPSSQDKHWRRKRSSPKHLND